MYCVLSSSLLYPLYYVLIRPQNVEFGPVIFVVDGSPVISISSESRQGYTFL